MPIVTIKITDEGVTTQQKNQLIKGATELLEKVLNKNPAHTFVLIEEISTDNWGVSGESVSVRRERQKKS
jgi:4-oxalocrotonate tautomerase